MAFKNHSTLREGTLVRVNGKEYGKIIEVVKEDTFRVIFWQNDNAGQKEGLFSSDELLIATDFPPFI